ncbi:hypothetical protein PLICRDRAFT_26716 [Plicaturopsis crispa FD-325 SS-3]|nr:hypothetical protein PLICRDRAFT_26716 [Plicaturopsis crispa FD-325 SS-3]
MAPLNYRSHLTILESSASRYATSAVFHIPQLSPREGSAATQWQSVTYQRFHHDVEHFAKYWSRTLNADSVPHRSVVGIWLGGMTYTDVLHIYGLTRAGYIPQLFSLRLPNPAVVFELLQKADAKALIYDSSFAAVLSGCPVPTHLAVQFDEVDCWTEPLPALPSSHRDDEKVFIFHTSGSTSGSPKLVPCSYRWLGSMIDKSSQVCRPQNPARQDVSVWMGSMCHIAQSFMLIGALQHGSCVIQPSKIGFSSEELVDMVERCKLNRLNQFSTFLGMHIRHSRTDPKLLALLRNLDEVVYSGLALPHDEEEWALKNGVNVKNLFGSTECGAMMISNGGCGPSAPLLRPLDGVAYGFFPIAPAAQNESGHTTTAQMVELVILAESGDCPDVSLRSSDGHFHTGDLFQDAGNGAYISRGRDDDWIKSENSLRCDTKAIEDNVRATCGSLIEECIVVGNRRPSPALFVECADGVDHTKLKRDILRKTRQFHSRRYLHERITSPDMIVVVPRGTLPRTATKGNIRRKAVEEAYKVELDRLYGVTD